MLFVTRDVTYYDVTMTSKRTSFSVRNAIMDFDVQQEAQIVKLFYQLKSPSKVMKETKKLYPTCKPLKRMKLRRLIDKFEKLGSIMDQRKNNVGRPKTARCEENVLQVKTMFEQNPKKSIRRALAELNGDGISYWIHSKNFGEGY